jgi:PiT family inorganic phosphate transporter
MTGSGAGVQGGTIRQIIGAWVLTLPATMLLAGGLFALFTL